MNGKVVTQLADCAGNQDKLEFVLYLTPPEGAGGDSDSDAPALAGRPPDPVDSDSDMSAAGAGNAAGFAASATFAGPRPGRYFGAGDLGVGYYTDPRGPGVPAGGWDDTPPGEPDGEPGLVERICIVRRDRLDDTMGFDFTSELLLKGAAKGSPADLAGLGECVGWKLMSIGEKQVFALADCAGHQNDYEMALRMQQVDSGRKRAREDSDSDSD